MFYSFSPLKYSNDSTRYAYSILPIGILRNLMLLSIDVMTSDKCIESIYIYILN